MKNFSITATVMLPEDSTMELEEVVDHIDNYLSETLGAGLVCLKAKDLDKESDK